MDTSMQETTLHGLNHVCSKEKTVIRQVIWFVIMSTMVICMLGLLGKTFSEFFRYETYTNSQSVWNRTLNFPALTFCNYNKNSKTRWNQVLQEIHILQSSGKKALYQSYNHSHTPLIFQPYFEFSKNLAVPVNETIKWCMLMKEELQCSDYIDAIMNDAGICTRFNFESDRELKTTQAGSDFSLHLLLDIQTEENSYLTTHKSYGSGMELLVHHPTKWPLMSHGSISLNPGQHYFIGLNFNDIHDLSTPYSKQECMDSDRNTSYSQGKCIYDCLLKINLQNCNCDPYSTNETDACTMMKMKDCYNVAAEDYYNEGCDCPPPCYKPTYKVSHSSIQFPKPEAFDSLKRNTRLTRNNITEVQANMIYVQIYFNTMEYTEVKQVPSMGVESLLASVGGLLGLFLGASIVTIVELVECAITKVYIVLNQNKNKMEKAG